MNGTAAAIIFDSGLLTEQVSIGRLVSHPLEPDNDYIDPPASFQKVAKITTINDYGSQLTLSKAPSQKVSLKLTELFGLSHERSATSALQIKTQEAIKQTLSDYSSAFKALVDSSHQTDGDVLSWIQNKIDKRVDHVYFVVGIHSIKDAELSVVDTSEKSNGADLGVPVTDIVSHGASALINNNALDVMVSMSFSKKDAAGNSYKIKGSRVVAVQYCTIRLRKWLRRRSADELTAEPDTKSWQWFVGPGARPVAKENEEAGGNVDKGVTGEDLSDLLKKEEEGGEDPVEISTVLVGDMELVF